MNVGTVPAFRADVFGEPATAGSKRAFHHAQTGRVVIVDDNRRGRSWRREVVEQLSEHLPPEPLTGPLALELTFYLPRPTGHYGTGRNADHVRPAAPAYPHRKPDALKLARAVEDALTSHLYRDDAQIVDETITKRYGEPTRVEVAVWRLPERVCDEPEARA